MKVPAEIAARYAVITASGMYVVSAILRGLECGLYHDLVYQNTMIALGLACLVRMKM